MGHLHWSTLRNLLLEDRHDTAVTAQNVAETHGNITRAAVLKRPDQQLRNPLGGAHHACPVHGLVRRDHDEVLRPELRRNGRQVQGAKHVVLDRLEDVLLHERNMFVRRRMVQDRRPVPVEHFRHAGAVLNAPDFGEESRIGK